LDLILEYGKHKIHTYPIGKLDNNGKSGKKERVMYEKEIIDIIDNRIAGSGKPRRLRLSG
jgi:hypothetical protein